MPCIQIKTNVEVAQETAQEIKSSLGKIISYLPDKSEPWLMITLEDGCSMWFGGDSNKPIALVEVKILGEQVDKAGSSKMTQEVCALFEKHLGVNPKDMYVRYIATPDWGWNGNNF